MKKYMAGSLAAFIALMPGAVMAHPGSGVHIDAMHGFLHPLTGVDHVLAMVAVGIFAARMGGKSLWALPVTFVVVMVASGIVGYSGIALPMVEQGIALSVIVMGLALAFGVALPIGPAIALVAAFAIFHGHAHGSEGSSSGSFLGYAAGFVIATGMLHATGIAIGRALGRLGGSIGANATRLVGAIGAFAGAAILMG